jgi:hypothetical protein
MSYKLLRNYPTQAKAYLGKIIKGDGISRDLTRGKPLLIIGDKPKCLERNNFGDRYSNIAEQFIYPTVSMTPKSPEYLETLYGAGKFEVFGTLSSKGIITFDGIGLGKADVFSQEYAEFVSRNPLFSTIYEMQERNNKVIDVKHLHSISDTEIRDIYGIPAKAPISRIRKTISELAAGQKVEDLFDGIIINGNGIPLNVDEIVSVFNCANIPVRYISASCICSQKSINEQRSVIVTQEIFDRIRNQHLELEYSKKKRDKFEGRCRVISMITKPRS